VPGAPRTSAIEPTPFAVYVLPVQAGDRLTIMPTAMRGAPRLPLAGSPGPGASEVPPGNAADDASPVRLSLTPRPHDGVLDGAWWPRTRQPATELSALVASLERNLDSITRMSLCGTTWDGTPDHVRAGDHKVRLIWFTLRDPHTVIVGYGTDEITLLVIPPEVAPLSGARAMTKAADRNNTTDPAGILSTAAGAGPRPPARGAPAPVARRRPAYTDDARAYDRRTHAFQHFRTTIVDAVPLHPGQVVLDVGCGTGLSFSSLLAKVGPQGRVVGIDASPEMAAVARERVARHNWGNVTVVRSPVTDAQIPVMADAAVFCAVHDILQSPEALRRVLRGLRPGAWVAAGGGKWAAPWMVVLNWQTRSLHAPYVNSFEGFHRPWSHLERLIQDVRVRQLALGSGYVMTGRAPARGRP
jgi:ubiquinone/menaquinone biosynthesis C-methylase UbiE